MYVLNIIEDLFLINIINGVSNLHESGSGDSAAWTFYST